VRKSVPVARIFSGFGSARGEKEEDVEGRGVRIALELKDGDRVQVNRRPSCCVDRGCGPAALRSA
jgi:hypothetical protein